MSKEKTGNVGKSILRVVGKVLTSRVFLTGLLAVVVVIAVWFGIDSPFAHDEKTTKLGFEDIGELATQEVLATEVSVLEADRNLWGISIPFTQSKYVYSYDVAIKAGYDFSGIQYQVDEENLKIMVTLPEAKILSTEVDTDSFKVYHESESVFRQITLEETNEALAALQENAQENAIANGLLDKARDNAETILTAFFGQAYDLEEYEITFAQ
ncbi:MAG: DUF4230 domain-containing protein [Acutalibacter sp.]|jgi:hypothetical protein